MSLLLGARSVLDTGGVLVKTEARWATLQQGRMQKVVLAERAWRRQKAEILRAYIVRGAIRIEKQKGGWE